MFKVLDSAVPIACWSCSIGHNDSTLFCPHCSKIQPPPGGDYFSVFGLEPKLNLDLPALEHEFHRLSRKLHPDRFARAEENEKEWSLADTALLNDAYRTLKDPLRRTEYLLKLLGVVEAEPKDDKAARVPADLLEEVFELNMQIEEMRANRQTGAEDAALEAALTQAMMKTEALLAAVDDDLRVEWRKWDEGEKAGRSAAQKRMVALLDRRRYLSNLVRDVTETLGA
ncbi:MAG: Fe-S protein assembly co-chaperone HscB [Terracidiphilus sp.]